MISAAVKALKTAILWMEKRFPSKMTTDEVMAKFHDYENRLILQEAKLESLRINVAKVKIFNGIAEQLGISE